ncbi:MULTISPECIES: type VI secretion system-associated FHA domain protein [Sphingomonas]|nr:MULTISPECIES: FHA domain-containing protein [Sphingomonas]MBA2920535.1 FHA domain-containing protein [Sphingomonas sp. CGMCC 1.13658]
MPLVLTPRSSSVASGQLPPPLTIDSGRALIGRANGVDILLSHPLVSAQHCAITGQGGTWQVQDMSTNGTLVNGRRVSGSQALNDGDVIGVADMEFAVSIDGGRGSARSPAPRMSLDDWGRAPPAGAQPGPAPAGSAPSAWPAAAAADPVGQLLQAAGLSRSGVHDGDAQVAAAGAILRAGITGLAMLAQARRSARQELKVSPAAAANNPITDGPADAALSRLMAMAPEQAGEAVAAACRELDAHQRAALAAMQAAFKTALDQFAPAAIKLRAKDDIAAWRSYEKAFAANDGFVEVFAQEFAKAYQRLAGS